MEPCLAEVLATDGRARCTSRPSYITERRPAARGAPRPPGRRARAREPAPPALEQLVDAQRQRAGEGQGPLHAARAPGRRGPPRRRRRRARRGSPRPPARSTSPAEVTEDIRPGVVSLPHGWGHNLPGHAALGVANEHAGVNTNVLAPGHVRRRHLRQRRRQRHPGHDRAVIRGGGRQRRPGDERGDRMTTRMEVQRTIAGRPGRDLPGAVRPAGPRGDRQLRDAAGRDRRAGEGGRRHVRDPHGPRVAERLPARASTTSR